MTLYLDSRHIINFPGANVWYAPYAAQPSNYTGAHVPATSQFSCSIPSAIVPTAYSCQTAITVPRVSDSPTNRLTASSLQEPEHSAVKLSKLEFSQIGFSQATNKDAIQVVSLGCACAPKLALEEMGRGAATLPFDWITTTSDGVLKFLRSGFQGFFEFERKVQKNVAGVDITAFRSRHHGFWHDDPTLPETREKYNRRFARMLAINARSQPVLFVRLAATTEEIRIADQLLGQLTSQFGPHARLLLIVDLQGANAPGPCTVKGLDNLLIYYLSASSGVGNFCEPIDNALDWAAQRPLRAVQVQDLSAACNLAKSATPGLYGMGGMAAFEGIPDMF